jgi:hypothetical protein
MSQNETIRVIRVLEYVGPREWVEHVLSRNYIKGLVPLGKGHIAELLVGESNPVIGMNFSRDITEVFLKKPDPAPQGAAASDPQPTSA